MNVNMMRRLLILAALVGAAIFFVTNYRFGGGDKNIPLESPKPKPVKKQQRKPKLKWQTFIDKDGGYRLKYPQHWKVEDHSTMGEPVRADIGDGTSAALEVRIEKTTGQNFKTYIDHYLEKFRADTVKRSGGGIGLLEHKFERIGTHDGYVAAMVLKKDNGEKWFFKQFLWNRGSVVCIFRMDCDYGMMFRYEPLLDGIAGSFKWLE